MCENGRGVARDDAEACRRYRLAADRGHAIAQHCHGVMYENGLGVDWDLGETARLYKLAAEGGEESVKDRLSQWKFRKWR